MKKVNCIFIVTLLGLMVCLLLSCNKKIEEPAIWNEQSAYAYAESLGYEGSIEEFIAKISGVGINDIYLSENDDLMIELTNGNHINLGIIKGQKGENGENGLTPYIGTNGNWFIGAADTGIKAVGTDGENGENGLTPYIGTNGNWFLGDLDTGIIADTRKTFTVKLYYAENRIPDEISVCQNETLELPIPEKEGYAFLGWYTGMTANDKKFSSFDGVFRDTSLYARYTALTDSYYTDGLVFSYSSHYNGYYVSLDEIDLFIRSTYREIIIPKFFNDGVNGYKEVVGINYEAFRGCYNLTKISMPNTIRNVGQFAFCYAENLESITIPSSAEYVSFDAFMGCKKLTEIIIEEGNTKYKTVDGVVFNLTETILFRYPSNKLGTEYAVPASVTSISQHAFDSCQNLIEVSLPVGLERIPFGLFSGCPLLEQVTIPDSVTSIGGSAFSKCEMLNDIQLPLNLESLGTSVFSECKNISTIFLPVGIRVLESGTFSGCSNLTVINLENVDVISWGVFSGCSKLNNITLSCNLSRIEQNTFYNCINLENIVIPYTVTYIGKYAFTGCRSLTNIILPNSVESIGEGAFSYCNQLESISLKRSIGQGSITAAGIWMFQFCISLSAIYVQDSDSLNAYMTAIGWSDFSSIMLLVI